MVSIATWVAFKSWCKRVWAWCKKNWKLFLGMAIPLVLYYIARKPFDSKKIIERINEDHEKEVNAINEARDKEIAGRDRAMRTYLDAIRQIEKEYESSSKKLDDEKKQVIKDLIRQNEDDPEYITSEIAKLTGIKIYNK